MSLFNSTSNQDGFARFGSEGFCPSVPYKNIIDGICSQLTKTVFFVNILQFVLVTLMYFKIGNGKYWKILYYSAVAGIIGGFVEYGTVAYVCSEADVETPRKIIVPFIFEEPFWVVKEYAVPFLNLIKWKAIRKTKRMERIMNILIWGIFVFFVASRVYIGYVRMTTGLLTTPRSKYGHTAAYGITALADLICTFAILYSVRKNKKEVLNSSNIVIDRYIKHSGYIFLLLIDLNSIILSFFNFSTEVFKSQLPSSYINLFLSIKAGYILILACDAVVFKITVLTSSRNINGNVDTRSQSQSLKDIVVNIYSNTIEPSKSMDFDRYSRDTKDTKDTKDNKKFNLSLPQVDSNDDHFNYA
ncbi:hypothetical protein PIROE2DRAFT_5232 [Piromyces sp. E2]|nr:hypothetical protein PIROE2DRAFT_5232 [Piromyces sp. E2]|eukprot:OUM67369.1 hypothetical protein PIROE2DRAFT_5232 [Piromyces sp. E2]